MMRRGKIVCFVGVDGSGKSTLSKSLFEELQRKGFSVTYIWWLECENSLLRRFLRSFGGKRPSNMESDEIPVVARGNAPSLSIPIRNLYPFLVLLDYLRFGLSRTRGRIPRLKNSILILDRYHYDTIWALAYEFGFSDKMRRRVMSLFNDLLPKPDLLFIIEVPPEVSYERKKAEYSSIQDATYMWQSYQGLWPLLDRLAPGAVKRVDNTSEKSIVESDILKITMLELKADHDES
jgi:thymidylate kinase